MPTLRGKGQQYPMGFWDAWMRRAIHQRNEKRKAEATRGPTEPRFPPPPPQRSVYLTRPNRKPAFCDDVCMCVVWMGLVNPSPQVRRSTEP